MEDKSEGKTRAFQPSQEMPLFRRPGFAKNKARTNENPGQRTLMLMLIKIDQEVKYIDRICTHLIKGLR